MGKMDTDTVAEAARRYARLRRRYWRCYLGGWGVFAVIGLPLYALGSRLPSGVFDTLAGVFGAGFLACVVIGFASWRSLSRFRCPRCGGLFLMSQSSSWPTSACKHCDLDLDLGTPREPDAKKPPWAPDA